MEKSENNFLKIALFAKNSKLQIEPSGQHAQCILSLLIVIKKIIISYMRKISKSITSYLHLIVQKCIGNKIDTNTRIQKLGYAFRNVQQMVIQFVIYLVFSLPLYHLSKLINTFAFEEHTFVSKLQLTLNEFELDSIDIKCPLIINKYLNRPNHYESSVLKNVWTNHYNQPPNSILGGPHVT